MSSRSVTALLLALVAALASALPAIPRVPTLGALAARVTKHAAGRILLFAAWAWLGWHLFAR